MADETRTPRPGGSAGSLFTFALLALFAILSLWIVLASARVYRAVEETGTRNHNGRTAMAYLVNKVRAHDEAGMVAVTEASGRPVLVLGSVYDGKRYNTYIYYADGAICEYFGDASYAFDASLGETIAEAGAFTPVQAGRELTLSVLDQNARERSVLLLLRTEEAGG